MFLEPRQYDVVIHGKMSSNDSDPILCLSIGEFGRTLWHKRSDIPALMSSYRMAYPDIAIWAKYSCMDMNGYVMETISDDVPEEFIRRFRALGTEGEYGLGTEGEKRSDIEGRFIINNDFTAPLSYWVNGHANSITVDVYIPEPSLDELESMLKAAIRSEDYERAAELRDKIEKKKEKK